MTQDELDLRKCLRKELEGLSAYRQDRGGYADGDIEKLFDEKVRSRFGKFISQTILAERRRAFLSANANSD